MIKFLVSRLKPSKAKVDRAGKAFRRSDQTEDDELVLDLWRVAHAPVRTHFQSALQELAEGDEIDVVSRLKQRETILGKLKRHPTLKLSQTQDVAGVRLIFPSNEELHAFRAKVRQEMTEHTLHSSKDYINFPKPCGYRAIHDIYTCGESVEIPFGFNNLRVEVQYKTRAQHAWCTTVEILHIITSSEPKFGIGDPHIIDAMMYASEIIARAHESLTGPRPDLSDFDVVSGFESSARSASLPQLLRSLRAKNAQILNGESFILHSIGSSELAVTELPDAEEGLQRMLDIEKGYRQAVADLRKQSLVLKDSGPEYESLRKRVNDILRTTIVLVHGDSGESIRRAFQNYFLDAGDFMELVLDSGVELLS